MPRTLAVALLCLGAAISRAQTPPPSPIPASNVATPAASKTGGGGITSVSGDNGARTGRALTVATGTANPVLTVGSLLSLAHGGSEATTAAGARAALGLPDPATFPIGRGTNTLPAGNDPRISKAVTPEMYGAVGDGVADDTVAITAAISAILAQPGSCGVLWLPGPAYKISSLSVGSAAGVSRISVVGNGKNGTQINVTGRVGLNLINNTFACFSNFRLNNANARGSTIGIQIGGTTPGNASQGNVFKEIQIDGFSTAIHTSGNPAGSLSGSTGSELTFANITCTNADRGVLHDDFNGLNEVFLLCDMQNCGVGWDILVGGCSLYTCSGEADGIDVYYRNPTNGVLPLVVSKFHSELGGIPLVLHGSAIVDALEVTTLVPSRYPVSKLGVGTFDFPPAIMVVGLNLPDADQVKVTIRNSAMAGAIALGYPADLKVESSIVKASAIPIYRTDFAGPKGARYKIENCSTATDDDLYDQTPYPDRWGVVSARSGNPVDSIRMNADGTLVLKGTLSP